MAKNAATARREAVMQEMFDLQAESLVEILKLVKEDPTKFSNPTAIFNAVTSFLKTNEWNIDISALLDERNKTTAGEAFKQVRDLTAGDLPPPVGDDEAPAFH